MIDFDSRKIFTSLRNADGIEYDRYVPRGWQGISNDFYDLIPEGLRYWADSETS